MLRFEITPTRLLAEVLRIPHSVKLLLRVDRVRQKFVPFYHAIENEANQNTVFSMTCYKIIMQHFLIVYHEIDPTCHLYILDIHTGLIRARVFCQKKKNLM